MSLAAVGGLLSDPSARTLVAADLEAVFLPCHGILMTAPTSALTSGRGLRLVEPGGEFRAAFRIRVDATADGRGARA